MTKICKMCLIEKDENDFYLMKNGYLYSYCNNCKKEYHSNFYRQYAIKNRDKIKEKGKKFREKNPEYNKIYWADPKFKKKRNKQRKERLKNDIKYKLIHNLRARLHAALNGKLKAKKTIELLGCTVDFLKKYLEKQFKIGMSWENYGFGEDKWHIDHIKPCNAFDLTKEEEQIKCFNYTNLQPLWQTENLSKRNKIVY